MLRELNKTHKKRRKGAGKLEGTLSLPGQYDGLIEEPVLGYREEQLTLVGSVERQQ